MIVFITPFAVNEESVLSIPITLSPFSKVPLIESISNSNSKTSVPDKLNRVSVLHLADPNSGYAHSAIDYLTFTENEPLRP